jgi:hypothetical protein
MLHVTGEYDGDERAGEDDQPILGMQHPADGEVADEDVAECAATHSGDKGYDEDAEEVELFFYGGENAGDGEGGGAEDVYEFEDVHRRVKDRF